MKRGDVAEAEALCLEQVEHVHARLAMDAEYRVEYAEGLARQREERRAAKARLAEAGAEAAEKEKREKRLSEAAAAEKAALDAKAAEKRASLAAKAVEKEKREAARMAEVNAKKAEAEAALAAEEAKAMAKAAARARRVAEAPVLEPGILATLAAKAREEEEKATGAEASPPVAVDPETEAREAEKRRKRAEKKARKKDEKRREKAEATASTSFYSSSTSFTPIAQPPVASDAVPVPRDDVDDVSVSAAGVRLDTTSAETTTPTPEAPRSALFPPRRAGDDKKTSANSAIRPRGARVSTRGEPGLVFGLTEEQRSLVAVAIALVAMCVLAIAGRIGGARA